MAGGHTDAAAVPESAPRYAALDPTCARYTEKDLRTSSFLVAFQKDLVAPARAVVHTSPSLARGIRALDGRSLFNPFGVYDGLIGPREGLTEACRRLSSRRLETFALCPFRFFMEYVLETGDIEEPELPVDMERTDIGSAYHRILYRLFLSLKREHLLPVTDASLHTAFERLSLIIDDDLTHHMGPIPALVQRARREIIAENLSDALNYEAERTSGGVVPRFFEWRFGFLPYEDNEEATPPLFIETPSGTVEITGKIDRVDVDEEAGVFAVIDYKTRRPSDIGLPTRIRKGLSLQLPLYLVAARDILFSGGLDPFATSHIYMEKPIGKEREERIDLSTSPDIIDAAISHTHRFVEMMHAGVFFPAGVVPERGCRFCEHKNHCRSGPKDIAQIRKDKTLASLGLDTVTQEEEDTDD